MAFDKTKFLKRFVEEAREHVQAISEGLLLLEKKPDDVETLNGIFRSAHTIKGSSKIMKITVIAELAHRLEDALDSLRSGSIQFSESLSDLFFKTIDTVSLMLDHVADDKELSELPEKLCVQLENAAKGEIAEQQILSTGEEDLKSTDKADEPDEEKTSFDEAEEHLFVDKKQSSSDTVRISEGKLDILINLMGEIVSGHARFKMNILELAKLEKMAKKVHEKIVFSEYNDINKDFLFNSVKDLSYSISKIFTEIKEDTIIQDFSINELQENSLQMRMVPLSTIFSSYNRVVRDIAKSTGKKINFILKGDETELDKKIIEKISDPVLHMIRNSIDHGIETPDLRGKNGKPKTGVIKLSAEYEGSNVLIKIIDDGAGIPLQKIKTKAIAKKIYTEAEFETLSEKNITDLIFHPGFSTSEMITDISGRGVGMDVVKKNIVSDLSGSVFIISKEGAGTTFEIRLPLTLAIMHMMVIMVGDMTFAVPSSYVDEIVRVKKDELIDVVDKKAIKLREQIIPVVKLYDALGLSSLKYEHDELLIMIVSVEGEKMGFVIDSLFREENRTIKALPSHMKNIPFVIGVTISGNKMLDNVLNMPKIIEFAKGVKNSDLLIADDSENKKINILVVDDSISTREIEKSILESCGYNVDLACDGVEALEKINKFHYDLVITDIEMPRLDGFSLTIELKKKDEYKDIPVILISSRDKDEDKRKGLKVGADAYIVKNDFDQGNLIDVIQNLVGV